jgi:hypothetical protein
LTIALILGFSSKGVLIKYTGQKISSRFYEFTDVVFVDEREPVLHVEKQKLSLDKSKYVIGDSLYGHIYLRMIDQNKVKYYAQGLFRAKVTADQSNSNQRLLYAEHRGFVVADVLCGVKA